ncbi:MAG: hypothetical protein M9962_04300 [Oligoflexia bacterium]|nr:hypothetical protein [Oligoflexia bacterium]
MNVESINYKNRWSPFRLSERADSIGKLSQDNGVVDRLRLVCFAELQARDLFRYGAEKFKTIAPMEWIESWLQFAEVENRHGQMLWDRFIDLNGIIENRAVSNKLYRHCLSTEDHILFLFLLSSAEERGMESGYILSEQMDLIDKKSANIFKQIAEEEEEHVESATRFLKDYDLVMLKSEAIRTSKELQLN